MTVVSNTSPVSYLLMIGEVELLPQLYTSIYVPGAVVAELTDADAPPFNRNWVKWPPSWLKRQDPSRVLTGPQLHAGEANAISLAAELKADRLIIDDFAGREHAKALGIPIIGTIGILDLAAERRLVDLPLAVKKLAGTNFRISQNLLDELLRRDTLRRAK